MKRSISLRLKALVGIAALTAGVWTVALIEAPGASASDVTNPAQHPYPVTVTIDGQTYHDGLDTLPGYDDYACTAIPDVQYDFADNEVLYYDDSGNLLATAPWTEWSRISSYKTWQAQQAAAAGGSSGTKSSSGSSSSGSTSAGGSKSSSSSSGTKSTSSGTRTGSKSTSTISKSAGAASATTTHDSATAGTATTAAAASSKAAGAAKVAANKAQAKKSSHATTGAPAVEGQVTAALADEKLSSSVTSGIGLGAGNTRDVGLGVLAGLTAVALLVWLVGLVRGRVPGRRRTTGAT